MESSSRLTLNSPIADVAAALKAVGVRKQGIRMVDSGSIFLRKASILEKQGIRQLKDLLPEGAKEILAGHLELNERYLRAIHTFLTEKGFEPQWRYTERKTFSIVSQTELLGVLTPDSSVENVIAAMEVVSKELISLGVSRQELRALKNALIEKGCENLKDIMNLPLGQVAGITMGPQLRNLLFRVVDKLDRRYKETGQNIYRT